MSIPRAAGPVARRRGQTRRAAVAVLAGLAFFAALELVTAVTLERWYPDAIDPDYCVRLAELRKGRAADPARTRTVVVIGSSRVYYGLSPEVIEAPLSRELGRPVSVVNFGFSAAGGLSELLTWRRLRADGVRPDLVLVEAWPPALDACRNDELTEVRMPADRLRWLDLPVFRRYHIVRRHLARDTALARLNSFRRLVSPEAFLGPWDGPGAYEHLRPRRLPDETSEYRAATREKARESIPLSVSALTVGGPGYDAVRELLRSCRETGVPAALLLAPESPMYRSWYVPETWEKFQDWVERVGEESGAPVVNAREWIDEDGFADTYHLLPQGAERFSERLGREYLLPLLRR